MSKESQRKKRNRFRKKEKEEVGEQIVTRNNDSLK
jgi:hypothetical protein